MNWLEFGAKVAVCTVVVWIVMEIVKYACKA